MRVIQKIIYGFGHFYNDLCAATWFSYLVLFQTRVFHLSEINSGILLMIGQVADALATPIIGYHCDKTDIRFYPKRKFWHLLGSILVTLSFPLVFYSFYNFKTPLSNDQLRIYHWASFIFYLPLIVIFQIGWAIVQISHMALIPDLSPIQSDRMDMNSIRYFFTILANICLYSLIWYAFKHDTETINEQDAHKILNVTLIIVLIGSISAIIFQVFLKEISCKLDDNDETDLPDERHPFQINDYEDNNLKWLDWLKMPKFYIIILMYGFSRLLINSTQVYVVLQILYTMKLSKSLVALCPLFIYVSSLIGTLLIKPLSHFFGTTVIFAIGCLFGTSTGFWYYYIGKNLTSNVLFSFSSIAVACILLGLSGTLLAISTLSFATNFIGTQTKSSAFVYGFMSFFDKLINGIVVLIIQYLIDNQKKN